MGHGLKIAALAALLALSACGKSRRPPKRTQRRKEGYRPRHHPQCRGKPGHGADHRRLPPPVPRPGLWLRHGHRAGCHRPVRCRYRHCRGRGRPEPGCRRARQRAFPPARRPRCRAKPWRPPPPRPPPTRRRCRWRGARPTPPSASTRPGTITARRGAIMARLHRAHRAGACHLPARRCNAGTSKLHHHPAGHGRAKLDHRRRSGTRPPIPPFPAAASSPWWTAATWPRTSVSSLPCPMRRARDRRARAGRGAGAGRKRQPGSMSRPGAGTFLRTPHRYQPAA